MSGHRGLETSTLTSRHEHTHTHTHTHTRLHGPISGRLATSSWSIGAGRHPYRAYRRRCSANWLHGADAEIVWSCFIVCTARPARTYNTGEWVPRVLRVRVSPSSNADCGSNVTSLFICQQQLESWLCSGQLSLLPSAGSQVLTTDGHTIAYVMPIKLNQLKRWKL